MLRRCGFSTQIFGRVARDQVEVNEWRIYVLQRWEKGSMHADIIPPWDDRRSLIIKPAAPL